MIPLSRRRSKKPRLPLRLNGSKFKPSEAAILFGPWGAYDAVTNTYLTKGLTTSEITEEMRNGEVCAVFGGVSQARFNMPSAISFSTADPWSVTWFGACDEPSLTDGVFIGTSNTGSDYLWMKYTGHISYNTSSAQYTVATGGGSTYWGIPRWYTVTHTGGVSGTYDFYADGKFVGTSPSCSSSFAIDSIGDAFTGAAYSFDGFLHAVYIDRRYYTAGEIAALHRSPYAMFGGEYIVPVKSSGGVTLTPSGIASQEAFGTPSIIADQFIQPAGIASLESFGSHLVAAGLVVSPSGIASLEAFGSHSLQSVVTISPGAIPSSEVFGSIAIATAVTVSPTSINSDEAFGSTQVKPLYTITPSGIASAEAFGDPSLSSEIFIQPIGIGSTESFGLPVLLIEELQIIAPAGIGSEEAFGDLGVFRAFIEGNVRILKCPPRDYLLKTITRDFTLKTSSRDYQLKTTERGYILRVGGRK